jgi:hypothetical protein
VAEAEANRQLARFFSIRPLTPPVDPFVIANASNILVEPLDSLAPGISGCLMCQNGAYGILYANRLPNDGFKRFTIAHELGHFFIEGHAKKLLASGIHTSYDNLGSSDPFERQANYFAATLLMPEAEFGRALWDSEADLEGVRSLADRFAVSLTAAAIRMAELSEEAIAVVVSSGTIIEYCVISKVLENIPRLRRPARDEALSRCTATYRLNKRVQQGDGCTRLSDAGTLDDWFEGMPDIEVTEEALSLGSYGKTLTLITCDVDPDEFETEDD